MENRNGQGIFYGVIGVATLVVAIIGATFAFFNAQASTNYVNNIAGNTLNLASALSVTVTKVNLGGTAASPNLVPATITTSSATGLNQALSAKCEKGGYTGCHVYKIVAQSSETVDSAKINLATLTTTNTKNKSDWKYVIYTGSDTAASALVEGGSGSMDLAGAFDMHKGAKLNANQAVTYYLMIYLAEDNATESQNSGGTNDATGGYNGTVTMTAGTGTVTANFAA